MGVIKDLPDYYQRVVSNELLKKLILRWIDYNKIWITFNDIEILIYNKIWIDINLGSTVSRPTHSLRLRANMTSKDSWKTLWENKNWPNRNSSEIECRRKCSMISTIWLRRWQVNHLVHQHNSFWNMNFDLNIYLFGYFGGSRSI